MFVIRHADGTYAPFEGFPHAQARWICDAKRYWSREVATREAPPGSQIIQATPHELTAPVPYANLGPLR